MRLRRNRKKIPTAELLLLKRWADNMCHFQFSATSAGILIKCSTRLSQFVTEQLACASNFHFLEILRQPGEQNENPENFI